MLFIKRNKWIAAAVITGCVVHPFCQAQEADDSAMLDPYRGYCESRRTFLAEHGNGPLPDTPITEYSEEKFEKIAYIEYLNFLQQYRAQKLLQQYSLLRSGKAIPSEARTIDWQKDIAGNTGAVATGKIVPVITVYGRGDGSVEEAAAIQLWKSASCGTVYFAVDQENFNTDVAHLQRSYEYAMLFADGLPDAEAMEKSCMIRNYSLLPLEKSNPLQPERIAEMALVQKTFSNNTAELQKNLKSVRGIANAVELVLSERTMTALAGTAEAEEELTYFLAFYKDLIANGFPVGVRFLETLPGSNGICRTWIIPNARVLSTEEIALLRQLSKNGGTVLITSETGTLNEWGFPRTDRDMEYLRGIGYGAVKRFHDEQEWHENQIGRGAIITVPVPDNADVSEKIASCCSVLRTIVEEQLNRFRGVLVHPAPGVITQTRNGEEEFWIFAVNAMGQKEPGQTLGKVECTWKMIQLDPVTGQEIGKGFSFELKDSDFDCIRLKKAPPQEK